MFSSHRTLKKHSSTPFALNISRFIGVFITGVEGAAARMVETSPDSIEYAKPQKACRRTRKRVVKNAVANSDVANSDIVDSEVVNTDCLNKVKTDSEEISVRKKSNRTTDALKKTKSAIAKKRVTKTTRKNSKSVSKAENSSDLTALNDRIDTISADCRISSTDTEKVLDAASNLESTEPNVGSKSVLKEDSLLHEETKSAKELHENFGHSDTVSAGLDISVTHQTKLDDSKKDSTHVRTELSSHKVEDAINNEVCPNTEVAQNNEDSQNKEVCLNSEVGQNTEERQNNEESETIEEWKNKEDSQIKVTVKDISDEENVVRNKNGEENEKNELGKRDSTIGKIPNYENSDSCEKYKHCKKNIVMKESPDNKNLVKSEEIEKYPKETGSTAGNHPPLMSFGDCSFEGTNRSPEQFLGAKNEKTVGLENAEIESKTRDSKDLNDDIEEGLITESSDEEEKELVAKIMAQKKREQSSLKIAQNKYNDENSGGDVGETEFFTTICIQGYRKCYDYKILKDFAFKDFKRFGFIKGCRVIGSYENQKVLIAFENYNQARYALVMDGKSSHGCLLTVKPETSFQWLNNYVRKISNDRSNSNENRFLPERGYSSAINSSLNNYCAWTTRTLSVSKVPRKYKVKEIEKILIKMYRKCYCIYVNNSGDVFYNLNCEFLCVDESHKAYNEDKLVELEDRRLEVEFTSSFPSDTLWIGNLNGLFMDDVIGFISRTSKPKCKLFNEDLGQCIVSFENLDTAKFVYSSVRGRLYAKRKLCADFMSGNAIKTFIKKTVVPEKIESHELEWRVQERIDQDLSNSMVSVTFCTSHDTPSKTSSKLYTSSANTKSKSNLKNGNSYDGKSRNATTEFNEGNISDSESHKSIRSKDRSNTSEDENVSLDYFSRSNKKSFSNEKRTSVYVSKKTDSDSPSVSTKYKNVPEIQASIYKSSEHNLNRIHKRKYSSSDDSGRRRGSPGKKRSKYEIYNNHHELDTRKNHYEYRRGVDVNSEHLGFNKKDLSSNNYDSRNHRSYNNEKERGYNYTNKTRNYYDDDHAKKEFSKYTIEEFDRYTNRGVSDLSGRKKPRSYRDGGEIYSSSVYVSGAISKTRDSSDHRFKKLSQKHENARNYEEPRVRESSKIQDELKTRDSIRVSRFHEDSKVYDKSRKRDSLRTNENRDSRSKKEYVDRKERKSNLNVDTANMNAGKKTMANELPFSDSEVWGAENEKVIKLPANEPNAADFSDQMSVEVSPLVDDFIGSMNNDNNYENNKFPEKNRNCDISSDDGFASNKMDKEIISKDFSLKEHKLGGSENNQIFEDVTINNHRLDAASNCKNDTYKNHPFNEKRVELPVSSDEGSDYSHFNKPTKDVIIDKSVIVGADMQSESNDYRSDQSVWQIKNPSLESTINDVGLNEKLAKLSSSKIEANESFKLEKAQHFVICHGELTFKKNTIPITMSHVYGNSEMLYNGSEPIVDPKKNPIYIKSRLKLDPEKFSITSKKIEDSKNSCVALVLPILSEKLENTESTLQSVIINYLDEKKVAGAAEMSISSSASNNSQMFLFPPSDFTRNTINKYAPNLLNHISGPYLLSIRMII